MPKYSISLTDELAKEISARYPDSPFSTAIAKLVRKGLDTDTTNPTIPTSTVIPPEVPDLAHMIRLLVQEEIRKIQPVPTIIEPTPVSSPIVVLPGEDAEWLTNTEVADMLPAQLPRGTRSSRVSRAVTSGRLKSNGQPGMKCRISRDDAIAWIQAQ